MNSILIKRFFVTWILFCALLSIYGYIIDIIFHAKYAFQNLNFLPLYFLIHLIFKLYLIAPMFFLYFYLFKKTERALLLKGLFLIMASILLENYFRPDDWSLYIGKYRHFKQVFIYAFAALSVVLIDELYLIRKFDPKPIIKV